MKDPQAQKINILMVDDKPANLFALKQLLDSPDYRLVMANSGGEALRHILREDFALILLDVQMPDMDGFETARLIRERNRSRHTPIIFITALWKNDSYMEKGYSLGAVDYLLKPIMPEILKAKVAVFVELFKKTEEVKRQAALLQKKAEQEHRERELKRSNTELEQFAYVVSHDLQEPLRKIRSFTDLLSKRYRGQMDKDADRFIFYITDGASRLQKMISDLLEYSRVGTRAKPPESTDCNAILDQALDNLSMKIKESGAEIVRDSLPTITTGSTQLVQLFQNLVSNAIIYRREETPRIQISAVRGSSFGDRTLGHDTWVFSVKDNGIGMKPEHLSRIFEVFQRLHTREEYPGNGIGLAICKRIAERYGGRIWVTSEPGKGSTFYLTLPDLDLESNYKQ